MNVLSTSLPEVLLFEVRAFADARGFFMETYQRSRYLAAGVDATFVQDSFSRSCRGTLRGLHYQLRRPQAKLVQVLAGAVFDVAADIRTGSPSFGKWFGTILSEDNRRQLWIPEGFAHGFLALSDTADLCYKVTAEYDPQDDRGLVWNDPTLAIAWPTIEGLTAPLLSLKDAAAPRLVGNADLPVFRA
jgi:dTDP-4-dehydrorhamnose 3,5-epimerase